MKINEIAALIAVLTVALVSSEDSQLQGVESREAHFYCGRNLAKALARLCYDYNTDKRSGSGNGIYDRFIPPYYKEQRQEVGWPWIPPHKAYNHLPSRGKRYFVVSECCDKDCSVEELLTYC